jgi:branched-chain amino acid transport system permease protein
VFLVMAVVMIVRTWGLLGKAEAAARRTPGLTVNPWRPLTSNERIAAVVALMLAASLPFFAGNYALTVGAEIAIFVIFAASLHFLMSAGGLASFGHAAYFGLGAYGVAFAAKLAGLPMIAALLLGPLLGLLGAAVFGFFAVQLSGVYFAMLTLAFAQIVWSVAFQWVGLTGGDNGILGVWPERWAGSPSHFYWLSLAVAALAVGALRIITFSPFGFALRATRDSPLRSEAIGIDGKRIQWSAFVIAGTVAGIGGALFAYLKGSVFPDVLGIPLSVDALVMVLLGGVETVSGAIVGAIVYKALSIWLVSQTEWSKLVLGGFIVVIVVAFPKGIVGVMESIRHRRPSSAKAALLASHVETAE